MTDYSPCYTGKWDECKAAIGEYLPPECMNPDGSPMKPPLNPDCNHALMDIIGTQICKAYANAYTYGLASPACEPLTKLQNKILAPIVNYFIFGGVGIIKGLFGGDKSNTLDIYAQMASSLNPKQMLDDSVRGLNDAWDAARASHGLPRSVFSIQSNLLLNAITAVWREKSTNEALAKPIKAGPASGSTGFTGIVSPEMTKMSASVVGMQRTDGVPDWKKATTAGSAGITLLDAEAAIYYVCYHIPDGWMQRLSSVNPDFNGHGFVRVTTADQFLEPGPVEELGWDLSINRPPKGPFGLRLEGFPDELNEGEVNGLVEMLQSLWAQRLATLQDSIPIIVSGIALQTEKEKTASTSSAPRTMAKVAAAGAAAYGIWHFWPQILSYGMDGWKTLKKAF